MDKTYTFKCEIVDEDGEVVITGSRTFLYSNVKTFGDCEAVDDEVGRVMRQLILHNMREEDLETEEELSVANTF